MKKRIIALLMTLALVLSLGLIFTACEDNSANTGNSGNTGDTGNTPDAGNTTPDLDIDENIPGTTGKPSIDVVTDSNNKDAQAGEEDSYLHQ